VLLKNTILIAGVILGVAAVAASPNQARAQKWSIGPHVGYNVDASEVNLGATAHIKLPAKIGKVQLVANPGFEFYPFVGTGASLFAFNFDVVYPVPAAANVSPYVGAGIGIIHAGFSFGGFSGSTTDAALNLKGGALFAKGKPIQPFAEATLVVNGNATLVLRGGIQFTVGK